MSARDFFAEDERAEIEKAISEGEKRTSGEIRVHLENHCDEKILDHAAWIFEELEIHKTERRNGVLIYIAVEDKTFAILGDAGINEKVPEGFWDKTRDQLQERFSQGEFKEGVIQAIETISSDLTAHFPIEANDVNELPNEISISDEPKTDSDA